MNIRLKEGWLVRTMVFSSGNETWEFRDSKPEYEEEYIGATNEHRPAQMKQIWYTEGEVN